MTVNVPACERPGCDLPAVCRRWVADPTTKGINLNEPGMRQQYLCLPHANEVREYVGGNLERLPEAAP